MVTWFELLTGCREESPEFVRRQLAVEGDQLRSNANGGKWRCGTLETPTLLELRERVRQLAPIGQSTTVREIVADVQKLHCDASSAGAMFQVASQFNLLEMTSPEVSPEAGVGIYQYDFTQGPACAIAAGAGTIYRNYFLSVNGAVGQSSRNQVNCLADIGDYFGNSQHQLWEMVNGYALPSRKGIESVSDHINGLDESARDKIRALLRIGVHLDTQVTLSEAAHVVSQAYCSAMPVSYTEHSSDTWAPFAKLILEAAYEATMCAAILNASRTGNNRLYLTLLGGGAFGNETSWIIGSIYRSLAMVMDCGLDVAIVSFRRSHPDVLNLVQKINFKMRNNIV